MKKLLLASLIACTSAYAQQCEKVIQVGSWNIQWLGNAKEGKRNAQTPQDIAAYLKVAGVDVLSLAEVTPIKGATKNDTLDAAFAILNAEGAQWKHVLFEKREGARAPADQWTGVAWNEKVVKLAGGPWKLDVQVNESKEAEIRTRFKVRPGQSADSTVILSRWPHAAKFSAGPGLTDFIVVPVHLKANPEPEPTDIPSENPAIEARLYEAELIKQGLSKLADRDGDVIIAGDSNMLSASEPVSTVFSSMGLKDCNARDLGTHITFKKGEKPAPFDRIFVMKDQTETKQTCPNNGKGTNRLDFKIVRPSDWVAGARNSDFRNKLSDHQLVRTGLCVQKDDD